MEDFIEKSNRQQPKRMIAIGRLQAVEGGSTVKRQILRDDQIVEEVIHEGEVQVAFIGEVNHQGHEVRCQNDDRQCDLPLQ